MKQILEGKKILIIGGTGTIGTALTEEILKYSPAVIRIMSRDEYKQFILAERFSNREKLRFLIGDVRDKERIKKAMEDIDIVFNLAAMKHVPACEYNPFEAVKTNILGVQNVIEAAIEMNVSKVIYASSDKAISPTNTMGATKLVAERLMTSANFYKGPRNIAFSCVRFGNVMGSRGSVIPLIKKQIKNGRFVTITDRNMTRFMMSTNEAVTLILKAMELAKGGEIFVLKMPVVRIGDFIEVFVEEYCKVNDIDYEEIDFRIIGLRPGEKRYEEIMTYEESKYAFELENMYVILPEYEVNVCEKYKEIYKKRAVQKSYNSAFEPVLSKEEIRELILKEKLVLENEIL